MFIHLKEEIVRYFVETNIPSHRKREEADAVNGAYFRSDMNDYCLCNLVQFVIQVISGLIEPCYFRLPVTIR